MVCCMARSHHSNAFFARVGGVSNAEMNRLELELLDVLDFAVAVDHRVYRRYREHLEKETTLMVPRRDDSHGPPVPGSGAAPTKSRTDASSVVKPPLTEDRRRPAEAGDADGGGEHDDRRKLPNSATAAASLRELWAFDY